MSESHTSTASSDPTTPAGTTTPAGPPPVTPPRQQSPIDQAKDTAKKVLDTILGRKR